MVWRSAFSDMKKHQGTFVPFASLMKLVQQVFQNPDEMSSSWAIAPLKIHQALVKFNVTVSSEFSAISLSATSKKWILMENSFGNILKIAETMLKLIGIVVTFEVIAFPAHNLEIVIVKHALRATSFVQFVVKANVMRMKINLASLVDDFITVLV